MPSRRRLRRKAYFPDFYYDMFMEVENQNIVIGDSEHIIKELNTIISDKDKAIVNKDILIKKKVCLYY